ncbi:hypothetical protein ACFQ6V_23685 [Streptomyces roseifaciens]
MTQPTREQLLSLVDRAERRPFTTAEAVLLRVGIEHLAADLAALRQQVGGLQTTLHTARRERDTARTELGRHQATQSAPDEHTEDRHA